MPPKKKTQPDAPAPVLEVEEVAVSDSHRTSADEDGSWLARIDVGACRPNPWNSQSMDAVRFARLKQEIQEHGFLSPITVVDMEDGTYRIIGGEHRWRAASEVGLQRVDAKVLPLAEWDEERQELEVVKLNIIHGDIDPRKFMPSYQRIVTKYGAEAARNLFAFTDEKKWKELVDKMSAGVAKTLSPKAAKEFDERARKAQTMEDLQSIVQEIFSQYGSTLDKGFMVFSYGTQKHVYITLNQPMRRALDRIVDWLTFTGGNINDFMEPVLESALAKAEAEFAARELANGDDLF